MFKRIVKRFKEILTSPKRREVLRTNALRNFTPREENKPVDSDFINAKIQSMKDSQGTDDFSGSGYNGPGNPDHDKITHNKMRGDFTRL